MDARNATFEEWLTWAFDHPVTRPEWHFDIDAEWWDEEADPGRTVEYLTRLLEHAGPLLGSYSDAQVYQGLYLLASPSCSDHMFALLNEAVAWERRERGIRAIVALYRDVFLPRCSEYLGHADTGPQPPNPLNSICYMWWDICPLAHNPNYPNMRRTDLVVLEVLEQTLQLPSAPCREGALHGLGHLQYVYPSEVRQIIDTFMEATPGLDPALRDYALRARAGGTL